MKRILTIADLFCGAGGTSLGALQAAISLGFEPKLTAINHWDRAIATHTANHGEHRHFCASLDALNPRELYRAGELFLLWASPECTHHSQARGGKPINEQSRATAMCVIRWAEALRPPIILVENVPEFLTWGPIGTNGRPLSSRKGEVFGAWKSMLEAIGYRVEWKILCAADFGDPTTRRRLFIQAVRGRRPIRWPTPTHAPADKIAPDLFGTVMKPWRAAREIIDWSIQGQSIFERKRPLSPKTIARIEAGLRKFGLRPFIVPQQTNPTPKDVDDPLPTVVADGSGAKLCEPMILTMEHAGSVRPVDIPLPTVTTAKGGAMAVAQPYLVKFKGTSPAHIAASAKSVDAPIATVSANGTHHALAEPFLVKVSHGRDKERAQSVDEPLKTVCGNRGEDALVEPRLEPFIMSAGGPECPARSISEPVGTILTRDHRALVEPFLLDPFGERKGQDVRARSVDKPVGTVTAQKGGPSLVQPMLVPQGGGGAARSVEEPVPTVACDGAVALAEPFLVKYYGTGGATSVSEPLDTVTVKERFGLVRPIIEIRGERYLLDVRFRMLQPRELAGAQGFPSDYIFTGTKTEIVKQIGNAVPVNLTRALVAAVLARD